MLIKRWGSKIVSLFLLGTLASGCSTIVGRQRHEQEVVFKSNVEDVEVMCGGKTTKTPGGLGLRQSRNHTCTARKEGYETQIVKVKSGLSWKGFGHSTLTNAAAWGWWTLGIGVGIGWLVDLPTGAMRNLKVDEVYIELQPVNPVPKGAV